MSTRFAHVFLITLAVLALPGCGGSGDVNTPPTTLASRGKACDSCATNADCESGLTCQQFRNAAGSIITLCGDANPNMTCPAR
jgi:hypothetical protein